MLNLPINCGIFLKNENNIAWSFLCIYGNFATSIENIRSNTTMKNMLQKRKRKKSQLTRRDCWGGNVNHESF